MGAAGALLLIAVVIAGLLIIKLDERQTRRRQLVLGLTDEEASQCRKFGISFEEMAERKNADAAMLRDLYASLACVPRPPTIKPAPDSDADGNPSDPLVLEDGGPNQGRCDSGSHGGG